MNKKIVIVFASLLIALFAITGGSIAYFTDVSEYKINEFIPGELRATITEDFIPPKDGQLEATKKVRVENTSIDRQAVSSYIRAMLVPVFRTEAEVNGIPKVVTIAGNIQTMNPGSGSTIIISSPDSILRNGKVTLNLPEDWSADWFYNNGYFYYKHMVLPGKSTKSILETVSVTDSSLWGYFKLEILSDAVQAEGGAAFDAWGINIKDGKLIDPSLITLTPVSETATEPSPVLQ